MEMLSTGLVVYDVVKEGAGILRKAEILLHLSRGLSSAPSHITPDLPTCKTIDTT